MRAKSRLVAGMVLGMAVWMAGAAGAGDVELLSKVDPSWTSGTGGAESSLPVVSADGRYVAFFSYAANLVPGGVDTNANGDVFLYDRVAGTIALVSHAVGAPGTAANGLSTQPAISADGNWVVFESFATNLVAGQVDTNGNRDVFLYERATGTVTLVSHTAASLTTAGNQESRSPRISGTGGFVAFRTLATNLASGILDSNGSSDIYVYDRSTGASTLASRSASSATTAGNSGSDWPAISADGAYVAFSGTATNLVTGQTDTNAAADVFLFNRAAGTTVLVSRNATSATTAANRVSEQPTVSDDGRYVAFQSVASDLVSGQSDNLTTHDAFLYDRVTGARTLVSRASYSATTAVGSLLTEAPQVSGDGNYVLFSSSSVSIVSGSDGNGSTDVFLFNRALGTNSLVSRSATSATTASNGGAQLGSVSTDGRYVAWSGMATNVVAGQVDTNTQSDMFLYDRVAGTNVLVSHAHASTVQAAEGAYLQNAPRVSANGGFVAYVSRAADLVAGLSDLNVAFDVFLYNRATTANDTASRSAPDLPSATPGGESLTANLPISSVSDDGRFVAFTSTATTLVPGQADTNLHYDVFLHDRATGTLALVSRSSASPTATGNSGSDSPVVSGDGAFVAFTSYASNLVAAGTDSNGLSDVFLYDRVAGTVSLVSRTSASPTTAGNGASSSPRIGTAAASVAFVSSATNLVSGVTDSNGGTDVFLYQRATGVTQMLSRNGSVAGNGASSAPVINRAENMIAFESLATNLVSGQSDTNGSTDVFVHNSGVLRLASRTGSSATTAGNGASSGAAVGGTVVAFQSTASNLVPSQVDTNGISDVFAYNFASASTTLVSRKSGTTSNACSSTIGGSIQPVVSANGSVILFQSLCGPEMISGLSQPVSSMNFYLYDRSAGTMMLVSRSAASPNTTGSAIVSATLAGALSSDGRYAAYTSSATDLVTGQTDANQATDLFLFDRLSETAVLVSHAAGAPTTVGNRPSENPVLSADGRVAAWSSISRSLVASDFNHRSDAFAHAASLLGDLVLTLTDGVDTVVPGLTITYTITVTNQGPNVVNGAVVVDKLPSGLTGITWTCAASGGATCTASGSGSLRDTVSLPASATLVYTATATVNSLWTGWITNTAQVYTPAGGYDPDTSNNSAAETVTLTPEADLSVIQTDTPDPVHRAATLTYTLTVPNAGPSLAQSLTLTGTLPAGSTFQSATGSGWTCGHSSGVVTCTRSSLSAGTTAPAITLKVTTPATTTDLVNSVTVSASTTDPNGLNNNSTAYTAVRQPGFLVTPTSGLTVAESGDPLTATFSVSLVNPPLADVTVGLLGEALAGTASPAALTFTTANWATPQTVTVTAVDDEEDDGDVVFYIETAAATSTDPGYDGLDPADVSAVNLDDDAAGLRLDPGLGLLTSEAGGTDTFTVALTSKPTAAVTFTLEPDRWDEASVAPASLTFDATDWNVPQTVTVTGVDDSVTDGPQPWVVLTRSAVSADFRYDGLDGPDAGAVNADDEAPGIAVSPATTSLVTHESGTAESFQVVLQSAPTDDVTVPVTSSDLAEGTVSPASLVFTPADWGTPQTVTVTGADDLTADGSVGFLAVTGAATSSDLTYDGLDAADVAVTNVDDEAAAITVTPASGLVTAEAGGNALFRVVLSQRPTRDVTVAVASSDSSEGFVTPAVLVFTPSDWSRPRTVTVIGLDDSAADGNVVYTVVLGEAASDDPVFDGMDPVDVTVTNLDDE